MGPGEVVRRLLGVAAFVGLAGCAVSDPTLYYTLGQPGVRAADSPGSASSSRNSATGTDTVGIGVGPVIVPVYLARSQIVTRTTSDQLDLAMFHRWAEPLQDGIARVLAEEIGARVPTDRILIYPWRGVVGGSLQYQVIVAIVRFDGRPGSDITLDTRWRILGTNGDELTFKRSRVVEPVAGDGYEPMVAAMTRALLTLGEQIAAEIRAVRH
jgi:hypothetical protein